MYFTKEKVQANAKMVRIGMSEVEAGKMVDELENVIEWISGLDEVNVDGIEAMISVSEHPLPKRTDTVKVENTRGEILSNAPSPDKEGEYFTVPQIID